MHIETAKQRVHETVSYLTRGLMGMPIATVSVMTDLTFRWLRQEQPEVIEVLGPIAVKDLVEELTA